MTHSSGFMMLNSPGGSTLQCGRWLWDDMPWNSPKCPPYWNSTSGFDFDHITAVDMSFCNLHQSAKFHPNRTSCRFSRWRISAILDFRGPVMGSLKIQCTTIALNCLVFEKRVFVFWQQMDRSVAAALCRERRLNNRTATSNIT